MENTSLLNLTIWRLLYLLGSMALILISLVPAGLSATQHPTPHLVFTLTMLWAIHRPDALPLLSVFAIGLFFDLLQGGPLGIGTACLLISAEVLRYFSASVRRTHFVLEWLIVSGLFLGTMILQLLLLWLSLTPRPAMDSIMIYVIMTWMSYPVLMVLARVFLGMRRSAVEPRLIL